MGGNSSHEGVLTPADFRGQTIAESDKRREPRFACHKMLNVLPCSARDQWQFESVELTDCSLNGLGFVSIEPMQPGEQFLVKLLLRDRLRLLIYTVRHCRQQASRWYAVGAEFSGYIAAPAEEDPHELLAEMLRQDK